MLVPCRGFYCLIILGIFNPAQRLYSQWLCHSALCEKLLLHQAGYWPLCRMPVEETADDAQGTVPQSENRLKPRLRALLFIGAAALQVAGDAGLLRAVQRQHTESNVTQQSGLRYTWSRPAAGATGGPTLTDRAGNHLQGVEYEAIIFIGTSVTAVAGACDGIAFLNVLFLTPYHVRSITLKLPYPSSLETLQLGPDVDPRTVGLLYVSAVFTCVSPAFSAFQLVRTPPGVYT